MEKMRGKKKKKKKKKNLRCKRSCVYEYNPEAVVFGGVKAAAGPIDFSRRRVI